MIAVVLCSARRPGQGPATEHMEVQVKDGLPGLRAVIHDQAALLRAVLPGQLRADADDLADERLVVGGHFAWAAEMFFGDD